MKISSQRQIKQEYTKHYVQDDVEKKVDIIELNRRLNHNNKKEKKENFKLIFFSVLGLTAFGLITIL